MRSAWGIISYVSIWEYNDFFGQQMCLFSDDILLCKSSAVDLFGTSPHNMTYDYATCDTNGKNLTERGATPPPP